jgi:hypothetical protein
VDLMTPLFASLLSIGTGDRYKSLDLSPQRQKDDTVAALVNYFVGLARNRLKALRANVTVQERSLQLAEQLAKENGVRVRLGQAPPIDLVQVEAEVADRRENLIRARAAADDGEDRLRRLIMDPAEASFWQARLETIDAPSGRMPLPDVEALVARGARAGAQAREQFLRELPAREAGERRPGRQLPVLLQVNVADDPAKAGFSPEDVDAALPAILDLPNLRVDGLMTIGALADTAEAARPTFSSLRDVAGRLRAEHPGLGGALSMGMSDDFEVAIEEGATIVRIGRALFGQR